MATYREDTGATASAPSDMPARMLKNIAAARKHTPAVIDRRLATAACSMPNWLVRVARR